MHSKEVFLQRHKWSSSCRGVDHILVAKFKLVHFKSFDYLLSGQFPATNFTHNIGYVKVSPHEHHVRAYAHVDSHSPQYQLRYFGMYFNIDQYYIALLDILLFDSYINLLILRSRGTGQALMKAFLYLFDAT